MVEVNQIKLYEKYLKTLLSEGNEKDDDIYNVGIKLKLNKMEVKDFVSILD